MIYDPNSVNAGGRVYDPNSVATDRPGRIFEGLKIKQEVAAKNQAAKARLAETDLSKISDGIRKRLMEKGEYGKLEELAKSQPKSFGSYLKEGVIDTIKPIKAGVGDAVSLFGAGAAWLGSKNKNEGFMDRAGEKMMKWGTDVAEKNTLPYSLGDFQWNHTLKAEWWHEKALRSLPTQAALIVPGAIAAAFAPVVGAGAVGASAAATASGAAGGVALGAFSKAAIQGVLKNALKGAAFATVNRSIEASLEAGGTYIEAKNRGLSDEEANKMANKTALKNMALAGVDMLQYLSMMAPATSAFGKTASFLGKNTPGSLQTIGKIAAGGAMEATEEALQQKFSTESLGDKFSWSDPSTKEAMAMGGLFGMATAGAGDAYINFRDKVINKVPNKIKKEFNNIKLTEEAKGYEPEVATQRALDKVTVKYKKEINTAVKVTIENTKMEATKTKPEQVAQVRVNDNKVLSPEMVSRRYNDIAMKIDKEITGEYNKKVPFSDQIRNLDPSDVDSPGKFYSKVRDVLKANQADTPAILEGLKQTTKDFWLVMAPEVNTDIYVDKAEIEKQIEAVEKEYTVKSAPTATSAKPKEKKKKKAEEDFGKSVKEEKGMYTKKEKDDLYKSVIKPKIDKLGEVGPDETIVYYQGDGKDGQYVNTDPRQVWHYTIDDSLRVEKIKTADLATTGKKDRDAIGYRVIKKTSEKPTKTEKKTAEKVAAVEKKVDQVSEKLQTISNKLYGKPFEKLTATQARAAVREAAGKDKIEDVGGAIMSKIANSSDPFEIPATLIKDETRENSLLFGLFETPYITDAYVAIKDDEVNSAIREKYKKKFIEKEIKRAQKRGVDRPYDDLLTEVSAAFDKRVEAEKTKTGNNTVAILEKLDSFFKSPGKPAIIQGIDYSGMQVAVSITDGENTLLIDKKKLASTKKLFPNAALHIDDVMAKFVEDGKVKAVIMRIDQKSKFDPAFGFETAKKEEPAVVVKKEKPKKEPAPKKKEQPEKKKTEPKNKALESLRKREKELSDAIREINSSGGIAATEEIELANIKKKIRQISMPKGKASGGFADTGGYANISDIVTKTDLKTGGIVQSELEDQARIDKLTDDLKGIEMPELVKLYKELTDASKLIVKNLRGGAGGATVLGRFYPSPLDTRIALSPKLFITRTVEDVNAEGGRRKETDKELHDRVAKTMAHEMGHLIDYLPNKEMARGNILGRLLVMHKFKQQIIGSKEMLDKRAKIIHRIAYRKAQMKKGIFQVTKEVKGEIRVTNVQDVLAKLEENLQQINKNLQFNSEYTAELKTLTQLWKPFNDQANPNYTAYRYSAPELYADFFSVLLTRPDIAFDKAPKFTAAVFSKMNLKPEVKKAFFELQDLLHGEREDLLERRYQDLETMFKNSDAMYIQQLKERIATKKNLWYDFKKRYVYRHQWAVDLGKKVTNPDENPAYFMEQMDYLGNKVYVKIAKNIIPIERALREAGVSWNDLSVVLYTERIANGNSREDIANALGHTKLTAAELRDYIATKFEGPKAEALFKAAADLRGVLKEEMLANPDLYTDDMLASIEEENFYAPFNIVYNIHNSLPAGLKHQTGNLEDNVNNIANNVVLKYIGIIRAGEKTRIMEGIINGIEKYDGNIKEASYFYSQDKKMRVAKEPENEDYGLISVMREGKVKSFEVHKDIADSFKYDSTSELGMFTKYFFEIPNKYFIKPVFTTINPGFQIVNFLFRDLMTTKKTPGMTWMKLFRYYAEALPKAYRKAWDKYDAQVEEMLDNGTLILQNSGKYKFAGSVKEQDKAGIDYILQMAGFDRFEGNGIMDKPGIKQVGQVVDFMQRVGDMFEATPKIAGYKYLTDTEFFASETEMNHYVRSQVGSPNFMKISGNHAKLNNWLLFYNAIIRGWERTAESATHKKTRSAFWWHIVKYSIIPALIGVAAEEGLLGDDMEDKMRKVSEYMKNNYLTYPIKTVGNKVLILTVPMAEEDRFFHAITRMAVRGMMGEGRGMQSLSDIVSYTGGQVPGLAPQAEVAMAWLQAASGMNPHDYFRNQNIFTTSEARASWKTKAPIMVRWTASKTGVNIPGLKAELHDRVSNNTLGEAVLQNLPVARRIVRLTNYGEYEANQAVVNKTEAAEYDQTIKDNKKIIDAVNNYYKNPPSNLQNYVVALAKDIYGEETTNKDVKKVADKFKAHITQGVNDANLNSLMSARSNNQKVELLKDLTGVLDGKDMKRLAQSAYNSGAISESVMKDYIAWLMERKNSKK